MQSLFITLFSCHALNSALIYYYLVLERFVSRETNQHQLAYQSPKPSAEQRYELNFHCSSSNLCSTDFFWLRKFKSLILLSLCTGSLGLMLTLTPPSSLVLIHCISHSYPIGKEQEFGLLTIGSLSCFSVSDRSAVHPPVS